MEYRTLGRTGLKLSVITMGTFTFGGQGAFARTASQGVADARKLVDVCIDHGVEHVRHREHVFNRAVRRDPGRSAGRQVAGSSRHLQGTDAHWRRAE